MLAFAIAAATVLLVGAALSWLKKVGRLTPASATIVGASGLGALVIMILLVAIIAPGSVGEPPSRGVGDREEPTKIVDVQLPTL